ncbi:hypothetical protein DSM26151_09250 [Agromyces marinus]|nr:hypothetical protein DSM26151_09250 [Agromyces marinus]
MPGSTSPTVRTLVRSGKAPHHVVSHEGSLARNGWGVFGANVGNLLFTNSVFRAVNVRGASTVSDSLLTELPGNGEADAHIERINGEFDRYVIPLANAFRPEFEGSLRRLTRAVERMTIPTVVAGVGVQNIERVDGRFTAGESVDQAARAFVRAVLEKSASIGVRGRRTANYLEALGFPTDVVDIIGCPSLNMELAPEQIASPADVTPESPLAINITPSASRMGEIVETNVARYRDLVYIPQEAHELALMMWGEPIAYRDARLPLYPSHPLYREGQVRFFVDPEPWTAFLRERQFAFGTRIHGTIAALAAGTPAMLLSHDARTLELAEYHCIPFQLVGEAASVDAADLAATVDFTGFNAFRAEASSRFASFLAGMMCPTSSNRVRRMTSTTSFSRARPTRLPCFRSARRTSTRPPFSSIAFAGCDKALRLTRRGGAGGTSRPSSPRLRPLPNLASRTNSDPR